jgi:hypothetical protein
MTACLAYVIFSGASQYEVFCPRLPGVNGTYVYAVAKGRYEQRSGASWLCKDALNGSWGVRDESGFLLTSREPAESPCDVKAWAVQVMGAGFACNYTRVGTTPPTPDELRLGSLLGKFAGK